MVRGAVLQFSRNLDAGRVEAMYASGRAVIVSRAFWDACPVVASVIPTGYPLNERGIPCDAVRS